MLGVPHSYSKLCVCCVGGRDELHSMNWRTDRSPSPAPHDRIIFMKSISWKYNTTACVHVFDTENIGALMALDVCGRVALMLVLCLQTGSQETFDTRKVDWIILACVQGW